MTQKEAEILTMIFICVGLIVCEVLLMINSGEIVL
jgi:hypothetical protein